MKKTPLLIAALTLALLPSVAFAVQMNNIFDVGRLILALIARISQLVGIITMMLFMWGLIEYIRKADDPGARAKGKKFMIDAIIGLTIAVSFWALVSFAIGSAGLTQDSGGLNVIDSSSVNL